MMLCPIAPELRTYSDVDSLKAVAGHVNTLEDASNRMLVIDRTKAVLTALEKEVKAWSKAHGGVVIPAGEFEYLWSVQTAEEIKDREGMFQAIEEAVRYGADFDRGRYVRARTGTRWTRRAREEEEGSDD
jgi:hypothetical protein